jgi:hypothetical protein
MVVVTPTAASSLWMLGALMVSLTRPFGGSAMYPLEALMTDLMKGGRRTRTAADERSAA